MMLTPSRTTQAYDLYLPHGPEIPLVLDSPHSWRDWPEHVPTAAPQSALLTSWDAFVDELWSDCVSIGAPLLASRFHRAYIDANRARSDIDPLLLAEPWPEPLEPSEKSAKGMGLIRRLALPDVPIYAAPLSVDDVQTRIEALYDPYHTQLSRLIRLAKARSGFCVHLDLHSMKSVGNQMNDDPGKRRPDVVVSDRKGVCAAPDITAWIAEKMQALGLSVSVNAPYQGAELLRRHGRPETGSHSVQIELNRSLYMDEQTFQKSAGFYPLKSTLAEFIRAFAYFLKTRDASRDFS